MTTKVKFQTPEEYISSFPPNVQAILEEIRTVVRQAVPEAEEVISYQIPAFKFHGWVLYYSAYKNHFSLSFPPPFTVFEIFKKELLPYGQSKSAVRFPLNEAVPAELIRNMVQFRAKENLQEAEKKRK